MLDFDCAFRIANLYSYNYLMGRLFHLVSAEGEYPSSIGTLGYIENDNS